MPPSKIQIGDRFGMLVVMAKVPNIYYQSYIEWEALCDCGNAIRVRTANIAGGNTKSCGCLQRKRASEANRVIGSAANKLYALYRNGARVNGRIFDITLGQFKTLTSSKCHYCGQVPSQRLSSRTETYIYNGIDRKDNKQGYTETNCLPCCWPCNELKRSRSYDVFVSLVHKIARHLKSG